MRIDRTAAAPSTAATETADLQPGDSQFGQSMIFTESYITSAGTQDDCTTGRRLKAEVPIVPVDKGTA